MNTRVDHKLDTDTQVFFYEQEFYVLSNFSSFQILWDNKLFATAEHVYHYEKFPFNPVVQAEICAARSAHEALLIARGWVDQVRPDWNVVKCGKMKLILLAKCRQHEYVRRKLMETGDRELIEDSWRDAYWGWGYYRDGHNKLGKLWMEVREQLKMEISNAK